MFKMSSHSLMAGTRYRVHGREHGPWTRASFWTPVNTAHRNRQALLLTRHTASTSMYSLTFCDRVMWPERHHWKPAVQAAAVMLRTPPVTRQSPSRSARTPRRAFALCRHIAGWTQTC